MTHLETTITALRAKFGPALLDVTEFRGDTTATVSRDVVLDVLGFLKTDRALRYTFLATLTAYDDWPAEPRFNVIYQLRELTLPAQLRIKVKLHGEDAVIPSCVAIHTNANWHEREVFDMFGITFTGHPDLRRLLMPADWQGHPLRKDYPLGYEEVQFTFNFDEINNKKPYATKE
jgi:NADH-quinone oxidoreductase subunit C